MPARRYTPEDEAEILAADVDRLRELAERHGVAYKTMQSKRTKLRENATRAAAVRARRAAQRRQEYLRPAPEPRAVFDSLGRFSRPSWFVEDLSGMTKGAI